MVAACAVKTAAPRRSRPGRNLGLTMLVLAGVLHAGMALAQALAAEAVKRDPPASAPRAAQPDDKAGATGLARPKTAANPVTEPSSQVKRPVQTPLTTGITPDVKKVAPPAPVFDGPMRPGFGPAADKPVPPAPPVLVNPKVTRIPGPGYIPSPARLTNTPTESVQPPAVARPAPAVPAAKPGPARRLGEETPFEPGQLLILWTSKEAATAGIAVLRQNHRLIPRQRHELENLGLTVILLVLRNDSQARLWRDRLRREHPDWVIDLNARAGLLQSASPRLYAQKMLTGSAPALRTTMPRGLRLGVIDTGLAPALMHPEALNGSSVVLRSLIDPASKPADPSHGSAVLQLMAGATRQNSFAGVAPPAQLFWAASLRDVAGKAMTNSLVLTLALDWLVGQRVVLVNMSLGGRGDAILQAVVTRVLGLNVTLVAAAGNNPAMPAQPSYPAAYAGVWAATAVDAAGHLYSGATRAGYTMLAAPGAELWVPGAGGNGGSYVSGTSYASALAAATLAWQPQPFWSLDPAQRAHRVCAQSLKLQHSAFLGCGLVQKTGEKTRMEAAR